MHLAQIDFVNWLCCYSTINLFVHLKIYPALNCLIWAPPTPRSAQGEDHRREVASTGPVLAVSSAPTSISLSCEHHWDPYGG